MVFRLGKRRDFFIKKWFQARIFCYYLVILAAGGGALAYVVYQRALASLRYCLFRGHVAECSSWEVLRDEVVRTNVVATAILIGLAMVAVLAISWAVARAARAVSANIRRTIAGEDPANWSRPPRPHEFRNLQRRLADDLAGHQTQVDEVRRRCSALRELLREARAELATSAAGLAPGKQRELHAGFENLKNLYRNFKA